MKRITLVILAAAFAVLLVACSKTGNTSNSNSNSSTGAGKSMATPGTSTASTSARDKIGVPECDDYITKYESCVRSKVPEAMRGQLESSLKTARDNWKKAAENTATRGTLAATCKQANDVAAASMKAYGCSF